MSHERRDDDGWLADPAEIYRRSFAEVAGTCDFGHVPATERHIAARVIHACGLPELAPRIRVSAGLQRAAEAALAAGCVIYVDTEMTRAGIMRRLLPETVTVRCLLNDPATRRRARESNTTLTAKAVDAWNMQSQRAICVIGNAPTALFRLLERMERENARPAAVLGFPVGFIGAAESKERLHLFMRRGIKGATMLGRAGGAGMAAAAMNAILLRWRGGHAEQG
jgi:precorrin-8X/cobalt-precorrin-8 methylmutase